MPKSHSPRLVLKVRNSSKNFKVLKWCGKPWPTQSDTKYRHNIEAPGKLSRLLSQIAEMFEKH